MYKVRVPDKSDLEIIEISRMDKPEHVMDNDQSMSVFNTIEMATATNNIKDDINKSYVNDMVTAMLDILDDRERNIVKAVYGIDADCEESFDIIALRMDLKRKEFDNCIGNYIGFDPEYC